MPVLASQLAHNQLEPSSGLADPDHIVLEHSQLVSMAAAFAAFLRILDLPIPSLIHCTIN